jgi:hypothetical protein
MSQRDELEFQGRAATKPEAKYENDRGKNRDHARDGRAAARKSPTFLGSFRVLSKHKARGFRQFLLRGLARVKAEWATRSAVHNPFKLAAVRRCT